MINRLIYTIGSLLCFFLIIITGIIGLPIWLITGKGWILWVIKVNDKLDEWYEDNKSM